jgi:hypothetical protein
MIIKSVWALEDLLTLSLRNFVILVAGVPDLVRGDGEVRQGKEKEEELKILSVSQQVIHRSPVVLTLSTVPVVVLTSEGIDLRPIK